LCRDSEVIKLINAGVGKNNSRSRAHDYIMDRIKNPQKKIIFYDSVNGDSLGRKAFLNIIPNNYTITLIYFEPATLIIDKKYEEYVDWLHSIRLSHHIFPSNKKKAVETIANINKIFSNITNEEREKYNIIIQKSYYDIINT
jgi:hypothetical protein